MSTNATWPVKRASIAVAPIAMILIVLAVWEPAGIQRGSVGEWAAAFSSLTAALVALHLGNASERRIEVDRYRQRRRDAWTDARDLGVELWVEVDRVLSGSPAMTDVAQQRYQVEINGLMAAASHFEDSELENFAEYLCVVVWQPLVALADGPSAGEPSNEHLLAQLTAHQDFLAAANGFAGVRSLDPDAEIGGLELRGVIDSAEIGLDW